MLTLSRIWRTQVDSETRVTAATRLFAGFEILLVFATWSLWWGDSDFPQVPLLPISIPNQIGRVITVGLLCAASCVVLTENSKRQSLALLFAAIFSFTLIVQNQHRLQAWHWLFLISSVNLLALTASDRLKSLRHMLAAIYVCSALSRLTPTPVSGMTSAIVYQMLAMLGVHGITADSTAIIVLCHAMTLFELAIGILLLFRRSRRFAAMTAILLHVVLIVVLGPPGLNHHAAVLLWNACLLAIVTVLFAGVDSPVEPQSGKSPLPTQFMLAAIWLFPISGLFGFADNWPSWQLYSSRPETWLLYIHRDSLPDLPTSIGAYAAPPTASSSFCAIRLDRWSLDQTGSPIYPEDRFQAAIIADVINSLPLDTQFQIVISTPRSPDWWNREQSRISNRDDLRNELARYYLNASAR